MKNNPELNPSEGEGVETLAAEEKISELEILRQSLEESKAKERQIYEQLLRLGAEFDNFRKRSEARIIDARRNGQEEVLLAVVGLYDVLEHAENSFETATDVENLKEGLRLVKQQVEKFLSEKGVTPIKCLGEKLDPQIHEALHQEENDGMEEGIITDEVQKGYKFMDRILRPAKVTVSVKNREKK